MRPAWVKKEHLVLGMFIVWVVLSRVWFRRIWVGGSEVWIRQGLNMLGFGLGAVLGWVLPLLDQVVYCLAFPHELTPMRWLELVKAKRYGEAWRLLMATKEERTKLILHSILFQGVFWVFGLWVVTSGGSELGSGLVLGAMLNFLVWDWQKMKLGQTSEIFWQIKRVVEEREVKVALGVLSVAWAYLVVASF